MTLGQLLTNIGKKENFFEDLHSIDTNMFIACIANKYYDGDKEYVSTLLNYLLKDGNLTYLLQYDISIYACNGDHNTLPKIVYENWKDFLIDHIELIDLDIYKNKHIYSDYLVGKEYEGRYTFLQYVVYEIFAELLCNMLDIEMSEYGKRFKTDSYEVFTLKKDQI